MKNKTRRVLKALFGTVFVVCLLLSAAGYGKSLLHRTQQEKLKEKLSETDEHAAGNAAERGRAAAAENNAAEREGIAAAERGPEILPRYAQLYEENNDLAGWLSIEDTVIDYPVMQCGDDEYYLHHDFYGKESKYGCLYVKGRADIEGGTNIIIYGHHMKDGSMFGNLDLYLDEEFYMEHPVISFDTLYEERTYEIMAVFLSQIYEEGDNVFKYYQFYQADTEEDFSYFYGNLKKLSLYDTGVEASFGDSFITLSTCAYHVEDGRFVVVARRVKS